MHYAAFQPPIGRHKGGRPGMVHPRKCYGRFWGKNDPPGGVAPLMEPKPKGGAKAVFLSRSGLARSESLTRTMGARVVKLWQGYGP
jgi:hypothetical protein